MWSNKQYNVKYIDSKNKDGKKNKIQNYARNLYTNQIDHYNDELNSDVEKIINNGCFYIPNFMCETNDKSLFDKLQKELKEEQNNITTWSKHFKIENPTNLPTFNYIIEKVALHFNVKILQTRLNYYPTGIHWKPFHRDSHKYDKNGEKENFTMGISVGASRNLDIFGKYTSTLYSLLILVKYISVQLGDCIASLYNDDPPMIKISFTSSVLILHKASFRLVAVMIPGIFLF